MLKKVIGDNIDSRLAIERLTALWALNECGLGGFMHAVSSPFTGIFVGGISILLITLIATQAEKLWPVILKSLTLVLLIKLAVSPHSPVAAYIAVSFQAFAGIFLFRVFGINRFSIILLGITTFAESALQKLLTLTVIYGESLWAAVDLYTAYVGEKLSFLQADLSSNSLILAYIGFYTIFGLFAGILIIKVRTLIGTIDVDKLDSDSIIAKDHATRGKPNTGKRKLIIFWVVAIVMITLPFLLLDPDGNGWKTGLYLVLRSALILVLWYLLVGPILIRGLRWFLNKRSSSYQAQIEDTLSLFPYFKGVLSHAWDQSSSYKGYKRMQHFLARSIVYSIHLNPDKE